MDFNMDELKLIKKVFGQYHKDKDISDLESRAAYELYQKVSGMVTITTKKMKSSIRRGK